jgi:hypothetical protein
MERRRWRNRLSSSRHRMRWDPYVLNGDPHDFDRFWRDHLSSGRRKLLFVVGRGFDFRAGAASSRIAALGKADRHAWILRYQNGQAEPRERDAPVEANAKRFAEIFGEETTLIDIRIAGTGSNVTSRNAKSAVSRSAELAKYTDVVIDISAMPRTVALTAIAQLIALLDELASKGTSVNLHVVVAESAKVDRSHSGGSLHDTVTSLVGFSGRLTSESTANVPRVWFPVLGEGQQERLEKIRAEVDPNEICPVIPFPSRDPRRGDVLIEEYRQLLFDDYRVEPANIIFASEYNPFEAYRQVFGAIDRYRDALRELGGCKVYVSPLSSKLLSVGALLACYDHRTQAGGPDPVTVGIPYVESATYGDPVDPASSPFSLYSLWLRGEWEQ